MLKGGAVVSELVSIDLLSTHLIQWPVLGLLWLFTPDYTDIGRVKGERMTSIFTNPNVFAGCISIGVFLAMRLAGTSQHKGHRRFHLVCLYINALFFFLAFSMDANGTIVEGFLVSVTSLAGWTDFQPVPLALCRCWSGTFVCSWQVSGSKSR